LIRLEEWQEYNTLSMVPGAAGREMRVWPASSIQPADLLNSMPVFATLGLYDQRIRAVLK